MSATRIRIFQKDPYSINISPCCSSLGSEADIRNMLENRCNVSHLCHDTRCFNIAHLTVESERFRLKTFGNICNFCLLFAQEVYIFDRTQPGALGSYVFLCCKIRLMSRYPLFQYCTSNVGFGPVQIEDVLENKRNFSFVFCTGCAYFIFAGAQPGALGSSVCKIGASDSDFQFS